MLVYFRSIDYKDSSLKKELNLWSAKKAIIGSERNNLDLYDWKVEIWFHKFHINDHWESVFLKLQPDNSNDDSIIFFTRIFIHY